MAAHMDGKVETEESEIHASPPSKKQKSFNSKSEDQEQPEHVLSNLDGFKLKSVLSENGRTKTIFLHGCMGQDEAVVLLEKTAFHMESIDQMMSKSTNLSLRLKNDIYGVYEAFPPSHLNGVKTTVICPATDKHVKKYTFQKIHMIHETWDDYEKITLPYLKEQQFNVQWVYNILEKKAEAEFIVMEDPDPQTGFVLSPDLKWDKKNIEELYLLAIVHPRGIKSLRDLTADHLPLLKNIRDKCLKVIKDKYGVPADKIRAYFHYQPSYYHLHVHFTHIHYEAPGIQVEKSHLLSDVIENVELMSDYYQRKPLTFALKELDGLLAAYRKAKSEIKQ